MSERRRTHRTEVDWCARILANQSPHSCVVRDISYLGARLALTGALDVPHDFELAIRQVHMLRQVHMQRSCTVVWRAETEIGVKFRNLPFGAAA